MSEPTTTGRIIRPRATTPPEERVCHAPFACGCPRCTPTPTPTKKAA